MEEWHQKLHNNSSPDDVVICEVQKLFESINTEKSDRTIILLLITFDGIHLFSQALLNYVRCGFRIEVYWKTLTERGLTKSVLASYDRPILSEPKFSPDTKEGLIRDLTSYLKTLKVCAFPE